MQPHKGLAVLEHLDAPAGHRLPPAKQKTRRVAAGRSMWIAQRLECADHQLAPIYVPVGDNMVMQ